MVLVFRNKEAVQTARPERYESLENELKQRVGGKEDPDDVSVEHVEHA